MTLSCLRFGALLVSALAGQASDAERLELESHLSGCGRCRRDHGSLEVLRRLQGWEPARLSEAARERVRRNALARAASSAPRHAPRRWALGAVAGVLTAAVAGWLVATTVRPPRSRILDGDVQASRRHGRALDDGAYLTTQTGGRVVLDGPVVDLAAATVAVWHEAARTVELAEGRVTVDVDPGAHKRFRVATARFVVQVVGTRFTVDLGGVHTERGRVEVVGLDGAKLATVSAGESWTVPPPVVATTSAPAAATPVAPPAMPPPDESRSRPDGPDRLILARQALSRGESDKARRLVQPLLDGPRRTAAEANVLFAESFLVERRYGDALERYRAVTRRYAGTPQAESALYACGQLEIEQGLRDGALATLKRYLDLYPRGRFAREARERISRLAESRSP